MADTTYQPKTYRTNGGDVIVVADGGKISVESGGEVEIQPGATFTNAGGGGAIPFTADGNITAGQLVYVSGYDSTNTQFKLKVADADAAASARDLYFVPTAILDTATDGVGYKTGALTAQNTDSASAVGDPVYLSETAGGWTLTAPSGAADHVVEVGTVAVKHASTGVVHFDLTGESGLNLKDAPEAAVADGDYFAFLDGGATGTAAKEAVADLATLFAGTNATSGLSAASSVMRVNVTGATAFTGAVDPTADKVLFEDDGVNKSATYQVFMDGVDDLTALAAAPDLTDSLLLDDAGVAEKLTVQYLFDAAGSLAADTVASGTTFLSVTGGVAKQETVDDLATFLAGTNITATAGVLSVGVSSALQLGATATTGLLAGAGADGTNITNAVADKRFLQFYCETSATSGDNRLLYASYTMSGANASAGGECLRARTVLTAACGTVRGAHLTLESSGDGAVSGLGTAITGTLFLGTAAFSTGTVACVEANPWFTDVNGPPAVHSGFRLALGGDTTGQALFLNFGEISGDAGIVGNKAAQLLVSNADVTGAGGASAYGFRMLVQGTPYWVPLYTL